MFNLNGGKSNLYFCVSLQACNTGEQQLLTTLYCFILNFLPPSGNYILTRSYGAFRKDRNHHHEDEDVQYDPLCVSQHKQRQLSNDCTHVYISLMMIDGNNYTYFGLPLPPCPLCSVCTVSK